jgi:hypothetical protein
MKHFFEIALGLNALAALFAAYAYLFRRRTWWPTVKFVIESLLSLVLP